MKKIPNLDTLRFIAASLVMLHHIEIYKASFSLPNYASVPFFEVIGKLGVVMFFVLSGFLITTLLLDESERNGTISFKKFYLRRILRIWPVYYLIIFLGFFVWPHLAILDIPNWKNIAGQSTMPNFLFYLFIFANLAKAMFGNIPYTSQTWSLATEEQFYLIWPFIIEYCRKKLVPTMLAVVFLYQGINLFLVTLPGDNIIPYQRFISRFWWDFNINCMAIGGIFAVLIFKKSKFLKLILNKVFFMAVTLITITLLFLGMNFGIFHYDVYAILFAIIISNLGFNLSFSTVLENRVTNYLGSISYGMYMYHCVILVLAIKMGIYLNSPWIIYPLTFLGTILISHFSYSYFESYFLRLKNKFENRPTIAFLE